MQTLYVMCGIPGSGKSTLSKRLAEERGLMRFSFDEMKCYTTRQFLLPVVAALQEGKSVVMDSTHLRESGRRSILQSVRNIRCRKVCVFMDTPFDECLRRNANRMAVVPVVMVNSMYRSLQPPTLEEGWDEILII
jgi:predicted kinase